MFVPYGTFAKGLKRLKMTTPLVVSHLKSIVILIIAHSTDYLRRLIMRQRELDLIETSKLEVNHEGTACWLTEKTICEEGFCLSCDFYLKWKEELKEAEDGMAS